MGSPFSSPIFKGTQRRNSLKKLLYNELDPMPPELLDIIINYETCEPFGKHVRSWKIPHSGRTRISSIALGIYFLVAGDTNGRIHFWDSKSFEYLSCFQAHLHTVSCLLFHSASETQNKTSLFYPESIQQNLFSGSDDHTIKLWDLKTRKCIQELKINSRCMSLLSYGWLAVRCNRDVQLWHPNENSNQAQWENTMIPLYGISAMCEFPAESDWSLTNPILILAYSDKSNDATVWMYSISKHRFLHSSFHTNQNPVESLLVQKNFLISSSYDNVSIWNIHVESPKETLIFSPVRTIDSSSWIHGICTFKDNMLAIGQSNGRIEIYDTVTGDLINELYANGDYMSTLYSHSNGSLFAVDKGATIKQWS